MDYKIHIVEWQRAVAYLLKNRKVSLINITRDLRMTYSHLCKIMSELEKKGIVKSEKQGRTRFIELTQKGLKVGLNCQEIIEVVDDEKVSKGR